MVWCVWESAWMSEIYLSLVLCDFQMVWCVGETATDYSLPTPTTPAMLIHLTSFDVFSLLAITPTPAWVGKYSWFDLASLFLLLFPPPTLTASASSTANQSERSVFVGVLGGGIFFCDAEVWIFFLNSRAVKPVVREKIGLSRLKQGRMVCQSSHRNIPKKKNN